MQAMPARRSLAEERVDDVPDLWDRIDATVRRGEESREAVANV